jgi:branched-chain amino acid transport system substrate-binding protein
MEIGRTRFALPGLVLAFALAPLAGCGSSNTSSSGSSTAAGASCDSPGISASTITLGDLYPLSGSTVSQRNGWGQGVAARFDMLNDGGGVNGRQVKLIDEDDQGTATADLDRAKDLVENKNVFGILQAPVINGAGDYLHAQNVPVIGHPSTPPYDGSMQNFIGIWGIAASTAGTSAPADFIKAKGGQVIAVLAHNNTSSLPAAQIFKAAATKLNLSIGYTRLDVPFVPGDFTADAQQMKSNKVDSVYLPLANAVDIALYKAAVQAGVQWKAFIFPNFYDPAGLAQVASTFAAGGAYTISPTAPFELKLPETAKFQAAMKKYQSSAPVNVFAMEGWDAAELWIEGLQKAGSCPTRQGLIDAVRGMKNWNGNGTLPPVDFGKAELCEWFVPITENGYGAGDKAPTCGKVVTVNG